MTAVRVTATSMCWCSSPTACPVWVNRSLERLATLASAQGSRMRIFTVGIGTDVNTYLLERLAQDGRGAAGFVPPDGSVEETVRQPGAEAARTGAGGPARGLVAGGASCRWSRCACLTCSPAQELVVLGRYEGGGSGRW